MDDAVIDRSKRRGFLARIGIVALNLITPGLGLIRLNDWRTGVPLLFAPFVVVILFVFGQGNFPIVGYFSATIALVLTFISLAALYLIPITLTWTRSRVRAPLKWWSHWYSILAIAVSVLLLMQFMPPLMQNFYKGYYLPSDSMAPTAAKNDKVIADMRWRGPLRRGEVVLFRGPDGVRISRIAAIEGDRIAMRNGVPIVNGQPATRTPHGSKIFRGYGVEKPVLILIERLPGETYPHDIFDAGTFEFDNMEQTLVPEDHFFVLGDNRDFSADSRVPRSLGGVGMVPLNALVGRAMYIYWSDDHDKIGTRFDH
ncbi:signal peptidase I [Sphingomonas sp.]|uniref:signal peptidase I n=1 Tax=Sphingomonas sp. TaxID=28214 RepID=UPI000DAFB54C|nr:signal peptidase I [Sphingomonas sp.]PZU11529.1 MAG: signal peptidase I [Sphingomonas sp.]